MKTEPTITPTVPTVETVGGEVRSILDDLLQKPGWRLALDPTNLTDVAVIAKMASKMRLAGCESEDDATLRIMTGRAIGLPAMASIQGIFPIDGPKNSVNMSMYAKLKVALLLSRPDVIEIEPVELTDARAVWRGKRRNKKEQTYEFTEQMARTAGLFDRGKDAKGQEANNYNRHPRAMYTWRAAGRLADIIAGDILNGIATREDLEDERDREPTPAPVGAARTVPAPARDWAKETAEVQAKVLAFVHAGESKKARELFELFERDAPPDQQATIKAAYNGAIEARRVERERNAKPTEKSEPKAADGAQASLLGATSAAPYLPPNKRGDTYEGPDQPPPGWTVSAPREFGPPVDALELDRSVRFKLGVRRGQSIKARCIELSRRGSGSTSWQERMASVLLDESLAPWEAMRKADAIPGIGIVPDGWKP